MFDISNYCLFSIRVNEGYVKNSNNKKTFRAVSKPMSDCPRKQCRNLAVWICESLDVTGPFDNHTSHH